ncbi:MAG: NAD-binding protein [Spirochaetaceae bacterium]|jgi:trk system potassium uptake protein TrkA|nr:NAD-binding protein [Spirochaetaceae bacterium]
MRIIIVGGGLTGIQLAQHLIKEKHDISLIESNGERARHLSNRMDCLVVNDEGNSLRALEEAGLAKADALVCVTESDEVNMIICGIAECKYPSLLKIARVHNDDYIRLNRRQNGNAESFIFQTPQILGIDYFVHPDVEAARAALSAIEHGALGDVLSFQGTEYELGAMVVAKGSKFDKLPLKDYRNVVEEESLITMIERNEKSILPDGESVLQAGDRIHILAKDEELRKIYKLVGSAEKELHKIGIVGGSRCAMLIAESLTGTSLNNSIPTVFAKKAKSFIARFKGIVRKSGRSITIIENNYEVCKELAAHFPDILVLNEDISDESFISEERLNDLDLIITCTGHQELNIITALYLKARGVKRAIAMVSGDGYAAIARKLGVDVVIPIKSVVVDAILSRLSGDSIKGVHRIGDGSIGILEIEIGENTPLEGKSIRDFRLAKGGLVMLVNREADSKNGTNETIFTSSFIPKGDYIFRAHDHIVIIAKDGSEKEIENFFDISL